MNPATLIAYAFVRKGIDEGNPVTQMKLQKMVYFAEGLTLVMTEGTSLVKEDFQAWKYGPVIPAIYSDYKLYGSAPILDTDWTSYKYNRSDIERLDSTTMSWIAQTWDILKDVPATQLSNWTHKPDGPWAKHYKEGVPDIIIPKPEIRTYFKHFISPNGAA